MSRSIRRLGPTHARPRSATPEEADSKKKGKHRQEEGKKHNKALGHGTATIAGGKSKTVKVKLTKNGRKVLRAGSKIRVQVTTVDSAGNTVQTLEGEGRREEARGSR